MFHFQQIVSKDQELLLSFKFVLSLYYRSNISYHFDDLKTKVNIHKQPKFSFGSTNKKSRTYGKSEISQI